MPPERLSTGCSLRLVMASGGAVSGWTSPPIPAKDYYSLLGVFESTKLYQYPLAPDDVVKNYDTRNKKIADQQTAIQEFLSTQSLQLAEIFASQTAKYLMAARQVIHGEDPF